MDRTASPYVRDRHPASRPRRASTPKRATPAINTTEIVEKLAHLSQVDLAKIDSYERKNENRTTILSRITRLRGDEPWPGYDELSVDEIRAVLDEGDEDCVKRVRSYEHSHKNRSGVIDAAERELVKA